MKHQKIYCKLHNEDYIYDIQSRNIFRQSFLLPEFSHAGSKYCFRKEVKYYFSISFKGCPQYFSPVLLEIVPTFKYSIDPNIIELVID